VSVLKKGDYVRIKRVVLEPSDRSSNIPDDTKQLPLIMWVKGFLLVDATVGDLVQVKTITGRIENGLLLDGGLVYDVNYGDFVPEILTMDAYFKDLLEEVNSDE
jgi:hypothetical protein